MKSETNLQLRGVAESLPPPGILRYQFSGGSWILELASEDHVLMSASFRDEESRDRFSRIIDELQQRVIEDIAGSTWPECPYHGHPLWAVPEGWECQTADPSVQRLWTYDSGISASPFAFPENVIRWFRADWGWGLIAAPTGDLWFHLSDVLGPSRSDLLVAGKSVTYAVDHNLQGILQRVKRGSVALTS